MKTGLTSTAVLLSPHRSAGPTNDFEPFLLADIEQAIASRFEQHAARYPDWLAVTSGAQRWTYNELNRIANAIAHAILGEAQSSTTTPVGLLLDQDALVVAAIMGTLKAGRIYTPLDPAYPLARLAYMVGDAGANVVLTNARHYALAKELAGQHVTIINLDEVDLVSPRANPPVAATPDDGACLLYTSGSTGQPKGVLQNHRNLLFEVLRVTNSFHVCMDDRLALLHSCSSSASLRRIFPALLNGASVHIFDIKTQGTSGLPGWFEREQITISNGRRLLRDCSDNLTGEAQFPHLRLVTFGGEPIYWRDVELFKRFLSPHCLLLNNLATTETGSDRHFFIDKQTEIEGTLVPVGYATEGARVLLLDENRCEVAPGEIGEIAVQSRYLALGYWNRPELTRERFLPEPAGGEERIYLTGDLGRMDSDDRLFCIERKDFQMKVRGHRIEGGEVETALLNLGIFKEAVVMAQDEARAREEGIAEKILVAYLLTGELPVPSTGELRQSLAQTLPDYMIPSVFIMLQEFPRTPSGKLDRRALPLPEKVRPCEQDTPAKQTFEAPRDELETKIAAIWEELFNMRQVGREDNFFDLGGHSLLAVRLFDEVEKATGKVLLPATLLQSPTIARLADALRGEEMSRPLASVVTIQPHGARPPLYCTQPAGGNVLGYRTLAHYLGADQPVYGLQTRAVPGEKSGFARMEAVVESYVAEIRAFQPEGPYWLCGFSRGGTVAFKVAQLLREQGEGIEILVLLDTFGPDRTFKPLLPRAAAHLKAIKRLRGKQKVRYVAQRTRKRARLAHRFLGEKWDYSRHGARSLLSRSQTQWHKTLAPHETPLASPEQLYSGRVMLFLAQEQWTGLSYDDPQYGWGRFIEKLEICSVPGDHTGIMKEPHVQVLARELTRVLRKTRTQDEN